MANLDDLEGLLHRGEKEKAYELIKEDKGITAEILMNEGLSFGIIGNYKLSISYFEFVVKISVNNEIKEKARENLAVAYINRGNDYYELNRHEEAIEDYNKAIELNPAEAYNNRGGVYYELKQYEKAIEDFNMAIERNPKHIDAYYNRGGVYYELKQYEKAIEDFNMAIELDPNDAMAYNNRGRIYHELNQQEKAIEDHTRAIERNPNYAEAYNNRGSAYCELKQYEKAIDEFNKAIELDSNDAMAYYNRGFIYHELNQQENAIEDYTRAIERNPNYAEAYNNRGNAYCELKQYEKAIGDCNRAIEHNPKYIEAYYNRGNAYCELKQYKKAIDEFNKAIELNPNFVATYNSRGNAYCELKQYEKAIDEFNKAIELNPNFAEVYYNRGHMYLELNQQEKAIDDYNKAIELNPNFAQCYMKRGLTRLQANEDLDNAIEDFKRARDLFEGKEKDRILGFMEWAKARNEMNFKRWDNFRERMNEARGIFEKINDPLSLSFSVSIKFSYLDEDLDNALNIPDPIEALKEIENALKNPPKIEGLIGPERTLFGARIASFLILSEFIGSVGGIDENTDLGKVKEELTKLHKISKEVEKLFDSVNFDTGKTTIVDMQRTISSVKQEIVKMERAENKKQKALEILKKYWSRLSSAIQAMNGISTRETENIALRREIREVKSGLQVGFAETREIISRGFEKSSEEHKAIFDKICETKNILLQKDVVNARYRIEIQAPLSSLSPIFPKIIVDIPMGNLTEEQIAEKADEITDKLKDLSGKVKKEFLEAIKRVPETGEKLLKRLKKMKG